MTSVTVDVGGYDFLAPPQLTFRCPGGGQTCFKQAVGGLECDTTQHSDVSDMARNCQLDGFGVPGRHAEAVAVLGADDHTCHNSFGPCQSQGTIVRVVVTFPGAFYVTHPEIVVTPAAPRIRVFAHEVELRNRNHPSQVGHFSFQGKGPDEYDPARWNSSSPLDDEAQRSSPFPGGSGNGVQARYPFGAGSVEERGPLLPPLGEAFMDGSIKPGHLALVRVSNNYHRWGVERRADTTSGWVRSHHGDRDTEANPPTGYWLWSQDGMTEDEINRCRVSNNPPVHQFSVIQGHGLDAKLGLGTADGEHDVRGDNTGFRYLDGSSVKGAPGLGATAVAVLQSNATSVVGTAGAAAGAGSNCCAIKEIQVTNSGKGYNAPPRVTFRGGGGHGAKARAVVSGGTVLRIELEPYSQGIRYETPPEVIITPAFSPTEYDANVTGSVVGHDVYNLDETSLPAALGRSHGTSNFDVGHGAFPGHPGNRNLGHPQKDCIYLLYSDIYVSPSGSDQTGQGTVARPYRTVQRCIDAALQDPHAYYTYKRADGGDPDPAIPTGGARLGHESRGERVDARDRAYTGWDGTDHGQFGTRQGHTRGLKAGGGSGPMQDAGNAGGNAGTGYSAGYTGRHMGNRPGRTTGWDSGSVARGRGRWEDNTRDSQKGFGYYVNRDRCVLKDGVYRAPGNTDSQPQGRVAQIWAENAGRAVIDCAGAGLGKAAFQEDRHDEASATRVGSVTLQGVLSKNCRARADFAAHHRDYYVGRPGYGPGARHLNGDYCWPGKTGCQTRRGGAAP